MRRPNGFTLVELLIGSAIFVIVAAALYAAFHTGTVSSARIDTAARTYQTGRIVLSRLESELKNSFCAAGTDSKFRGDAHSLEFLAVVDTFDRGAGVYPEVCRIRYEFRDGVITRACYKGPDAYKAPAGAARAQELSEDVAGFELTFAVPLDRANSEYDWQAVWPKNEDQKKNMPLAVKIKMTVKGIVFTKVVALPLADW